MKGERRRLLRHVFRLQVGSGDLVILGDRARALSAPLIELPHTLIDIGLLGDLVEQIVTTVRTAQYTSWAFGQRVRQAGLLAWMGTVGDALDNAVAESFFATLQTELLDRQRWSTRRELAQAIFDWIEVFYNQQLRHSTLGMQPPSPTPQPPTPHLRHDQNHHTPGVRGTGGTPPRRRR